MAPRREPVRWSAERELSPALRRSLLLARQGLLNRQEPDGSWSPRHNGDAGLRARFALLLVGLGLADGDRVDRLADGLLADQLPDGGWAAPASGALDLSASVLAYAAVKLRRGPAVSVPLRGARRKIVEAGGAAAADPETRAWLALFGMHAWPDAAPEEAWAGAAGDGPLRRVDALHSVRELFAVEPVAAPAPQGQVPPAAKLFWLRLALARRGADAERNAIESVEAAIESLVEDDPAAGRLAVASRGDAVGLTGAALRALVATGCLANETEHAASFLLADAEAVETERDTDLGAETLAALVAWRARERPGGALPPTLRVVGGDASRPRSGGGVVGVDAAVARFSHRLIERQTEEGSWADSVATTARVASALVGVAGAGDAVPAAARAAEWLRGAQQADGGWRAEAGESRVGVVGAAVAALSSLAGSSAGDDDTLLAGANWLIVHQLPGGGWGDDSNGPAASNLATAAALAGLTAAGLQHSSAAEQAARFLLAEQTETGQWRAAPHAADATPVVTWALAEWAAASRAKPLDAAPVCLRVVACDTVGA